MKLDQKVVVELQALTDAYVGCMQIQEVAVDEN